MEIFLVFSTEETLLCSTFFFPGTINCLFNSPLSCLASGRPEDSGNKANLMFAMKRQYPYGEVNGTWPDYLVNRDDRKMRGHSGKNIPQKSRIVVQ